MRRLLTIILLAALPVITFAGKPTKSKLSSGDMGHPQMLHLRTNLLYDALLVPNIGIETGLSDRFSLVGNVMFDWLGFSQKQLYWRILSGDAEVRYWLGTDVSGFLRKGHHIGLYGALYRYDVELGDDGQMGDFNYGGGISYGYSAPLNRSLSLDMSIGIGYMGGEYKKYKYIDGRYVWQSDNDRNYFGPTKAEVTLVWHFEIPKRKYSGTIKKGGSL